MCAVYMHVVTWSVLGFSHTYTYTTCKEMKVCSIVSKDWCVPVVHVSLMYRNVFNYYCKLADGSNT